jgi:hypothetical protein
MSQMSFSTAKTPELTQVSRFDAPSADFDGYFRLPQEAAKAGSRLPCGILAESHWVGGQ